MRIAVDGMGGDRAPEVIVEGALQAAEEYGIDILLVGPSESLADKLDRSGIKGLPITIHAASQVVGMHDSPMVALRKKPDSSIMIAAKLLKDGEADGLFTAGNTGAVMAVTKVVLGALKGVERPAIAVLIPTRTGSSVLIDVGANVDCKPGHLLQFAIMGRVYVEEILGRPMPRVGILNIGEEGAKGNELTKKTYRLLRASSLNFVGNIEGRDIMAGRADVVVCDGFVGNIVLKFAEGLGEMIVAALKGGISREESSIIEDSLRGLERRLDYSEYGGAPLLGIDGVCIISHGSSSPKAVKNGIKLAADFVNHQVNDHIVEAIG
jgi:glycerol-3-phosphate acyltransferase PlsX